MIRFSSDDQLEREPQSSQSGSATPGLSRGPMEMKLIFTGFCPSVTLKATLDPFALIVAPASFAGPVVSAVSRPVTRFFSQTSRLPRRVETKAALFPSEET